LKQQNRETSLFSKREEFALKRTYMRALALAFIVFAATALHLPSTALSQTGDGWTQLFDGKTLGDWDMVGEANWRVEDGAIVADKLTSKSAAHLVSKTKYKDFMIYVEFWSSDDANSGVFLRCQNPKEITDKSCYEAKILDQRKDPSYGTGGIVNFAEVNPMPKAGGKWNTYEITAKGRQITLLLNGQKTADLKNGLFAEGVLTLQYGSGVMKFRKVAIKPLCRPHYDAPSPPVRGGGFFFAPRRSLTPPAPLRHAPCTVPPKINKD
jgi:hypothetical protein